MDNNNISWAAGIQNHSRMIKEGTGKRALEVSAGQNREIKTMLYYF